ncbi:1-aminocyclopropane-1-carboxylate deaminase/D-cysteine desulfhydrase [Porphyromonas macacae]|uniref:1-aminocyclopropane-1-carboxylate deaminase/D-cysteine desulfhydrase n=1 Tax=Porphyromonas macacae TaxID=28115 RepID=UPI0024ACC9F9|nr:pyridoxal-phosphate dependent enzyme [Porphyromonas macacae]
MTYIKLETISIEKEQLHIIRDDVFPFVGGGNKSRKALYYEEYMIKNGYNAIVTTGGIHSNHNRAMALIATRNNWPCHLVYHGKRERFFNECGNPQLVKATNATYEFVDTDKIASAMDQAVVSFKSLGLNPLYVTGGGHDLPGGLAYINATTELVSIFRQNNWFPKAIFLACGTGSTLAGIAAGLIKEQLSTKVIGVSIARNKGRAESVISDFSSLLCKSQNITYQKNYEIKDDYLYGGYESYTSKMKIWLADIIKKTGIIFDTTYSGKALWGAYSYAKEREIELKDILFWHTGGILNYLAQQ